MKILVVGDPHFRLDEPYADHIKDRRKAERAGVLRTIHEAAEDCDAVVLMGDNLDKRHNHSSVLKEFTDFLEGFGGKDIFILSGNHETYEGNKTALDFLIGKKERWIVLTPAETVHFLDYNGTNLAFIPYQTRAALGTKTDEEGIEKIASYMEENGEQDIIFAHHGISGTKALGAMTDLFSEVILPKERLEKITRLLVGGHIHQPSAEGKTIVTGSISTQEMGEVEKCVWKIDTKDFSYAKIPLPVRPIYKLEVNDGKYLSGLDMLNKSSIIKVINRDKSTDVEALKEKLSEFDAWIFLEDYPDERKKLNVDEKKTLDMSIGSLLTLYAEARKKDPERLHKALGIVQES